MKKKNIVLSLFVGVAALSALASCGKKKGDKKDDVTTTSEVSQSTSTSEVSSTTTSDVTPSSTTTSDVTPSSTSTSDVTSSSASTSTSTSITSITMQTVVSYNLASGSMESDETYNVEYDSVAGLDYKIISEIPTYAGYRFAGWKVSDDDTIYQAGDTYHIDEDHESPIFVAQWVKQVNVNLNANSPFGTVNTIKVDENGSFVVTAPEERENYTFLGYASSFTATEAAYEVGDTVNVESKDISLYGVWAGDTVELSYVISNNSYPLQNKVPKTENVQSGKEITLPNPDFSEYGLTFLGWSKKVYSAATPTNFTVDFKGGDKIPVDELDVEDGKATLYGCYINATAHPFVENAVMQPTIYSRGFKLYKCSIAGHTEQYVEAISNRDILAARVTDVFTLNGRGTVATAIIDNGTANLGDSVSIILQDGTIVSSVITGIEKYRTSLESATKGDTVGILLRGVDKEQIKTAQLITTPGKEYAGQKLRVKAHILSEDEGGNHTPVMKGYKPIVYVRGLSYGTFNVVHIYQNGLSEVDLAMPGDDVTLDIEIVGENVYAPIWTGLEGVLREGGRTTATFEVTDILGQYVY